jgi:uncharacterized protein YcbK (DUF882 family)/LysM repeat protein
VPRRLRPRLSLLAAVALGLVAAPASQAQVRGVGARTVTVGGTPQAHVVSRGETLGGIALRYGVTVRQLAERNHLAEPYALRNGQRLQLPHNAADSAPAPAAPTRPGARPVAGASERVPASERGPAAPAVPARTMMALERTAARGSGRYGRPRRPGMVSLRRLATDERVTTLLRRPNRGVLGLMRRFLRATSGESHPIEPRLLRQLAIVSDHFGGRPVTVISGFRPFRRGQHTAHSNHNVGHAIDFRIEGVRNRELWEYCRSLPHTGCGYYPRSVFVHMDVRGDSAVWVDWSRPGERPRYGSLSGPPPPRPHGAPPPPAPPGAPPVGAEPEVNDVAAEAPHIRTATPEPDDDHTTTGSPLVPPAAAPEPELPSGD